MCVCMYVRKLLAILKLRPVAWKAHGALMCKSSLKRMRPDATGDCPAVHTGPRALPDLAG